MPNWNSWTNPGDDADSEVDQEQLTEETSHAVVMLVLRTIRGRLQAGHQETET